MVRPLEPAVSRPRLRRSVVAAVAFAIFLIVIIYAANRGIRHPGHVLVEALPFGDKFGHAGLWAAMTLVANLAVRRWLTVPGWPRQAVRVPVASAALAVFVTLEEASQFFIESRTLDAFDLVANYVGITVGSMTFWAFSRSWSTDS